ncbi:MAG: hypothetical protein M1829_006134 [Trizodia sp. TS-e1964]|nr:MAG: hypothetical protein M1829_006134 [Trizodia sp. TS-e1964]
MNLNSTQKNGRIRDITTNIPETLPSVTITRAGSSPITPVERVNDERIGRLPSNIKFYNAPAQDSAIRPSLPKPIKKALTEEPSAWRPITLRTPILAATVLIAILLAALIEILYQICEKRGGIAFASASGNFTQAQTFSYSYLPTIVSVFYSMLWSWIDLDVKRLEPFLQLSKPEGASATSSILLKYPYEFLASVPIKAAKRRHWAVVFAGTALVIVVWGITPFQSAIFTKNTVSLSSQIPLFTSTKFIPADTQNLALSLEFTYSVYGISWLNETLPPFMTREFALAPFLAEFEPLAFEDSETWTANTTMFTMDLNCQPAIQIINDIGQMAFSNGRGCSYPLINIRTIDSNPNVNYVALYVGYWSNDYADYYLEQSKWCPSNNSHSFFAFWDRIGEINATTSTSLFCEPSYHSQNVSATISLPGRSVNSVTALGPRQPLPSNIFNVTAFESLLSAGESKLTQRSDFPILSTPQQSFRLERFQIAQPATAMVGFTLAAHQRPTEEYLNPDVLIESLQAAHRLLFARAMNFVMKSDLDQAIQTQAQREYKRKAVIVVRPFSLLVEILLLVVAILASSLLYVVTKRPNSLKTDPSPTMALMSMVADGEELLSDFNIMDMAKGKDLIKNFRNHRYKLGNWPGPKSQFRLDKTLCPPEKSYTSASISTKRIEKLLLAEEAKQPIELRLTTGLLFVSVLIALISSGVVISRKSLVENGLPLPSSSIFIKGLVLNYIPTAISTLMEPLWVVLNRILCLLQPFEDLRRGNASAATSINSSYSSLPPQLVFWKAFWSRHYLLTAVCGMALIANLLAVSLSGIFQESQVDIFTPFEFSQPYLPKFKELHNVGKTVITDYERNYYYIANSNITRGNSLTPWTTNYTFLLPFQPPIADSSHDRYQVETVGFSTELDCFDLSSEVSNTIIYGSNLGPALGNNIVNVNTTLKDRNETSFPCLINGADFLFLARDLEEVLRPWPAGTRISMEFLNIMSHTNVNASQAQIDFCRSILFMGWAQSIKDKPVNDTIEATSKLFIGCRPQIQVATYRVTTDPDGSVDNIARISPFETDVSPYFTTRPFDLYAQINYAIAGGRNDVCWHNDSFPSDWVNYFMEKTGANTSFLDPNSPLPSADQAIASFTPIYKRLFPIILSDVTDRFLLPAPSGTTAQGSGLKATPRVFLSPVMFIITEVILCLYLVVACALYYLRPASCLPRLPISIAALVAYFAASRALVALRGTASLSSRQREAFAAEHGMTFTYGCYIGTDGHSHLGIDLHQNVVPVAKTGSLIKRARTLRDFDPEHVF